MKIFYCQQASIIDWYLNKFEKNNLEKSHDELLSKLASYGFVTLFGLDILDSFISVSSSKILQAKWANENNVKYSEKNWQKEILAAQIEKFQPDVIYTGNYVFFNKEMKSYLPKAKLYALWNASPMQEGIDLSHFDVGLSFNEIYHRHLQHRGVKNVEYNSFYIDPEIKNRLNSMLLPKDIDIAILQCLKYEINFYMMYI
jgi:hypothetical protein